MGREGNEIHFRSRGYIFSKFCLIPLVVFSASKLRKQIKVELQKKNNKVERLILQRKRILDAQKTVLALYYSAYRQS